MRKRLRKNERGKKRAEASRRRETNQPKRKKQRLEEEPTRGRAEEEEEETEAGSRRKTIPPVTPTKRKVVREEREKRTPKRRKQNADMRKYISCKRWKEDGGDGGGGEEERKQTDILLGLGRRLDTTSPAVTVQEEVIEESTTDILLGLGRRLDTTSPAVTVQEEVLDESTTDILLGLGRRLDTTSPAVTVQEEGIEESTTDPEKDTPRREEGYRAQGEQADHHQHHPPGDAEPGDQGHQQQAASEQQDLPGSGGESCNYSMHLRMPRSILWASQGGIAPDLMPIKQIVTCTLSFETKEDIDKDHQHHPHHSQGQADERLSARGGEDHQGSQDHMQQGAQPQTQEHQGDQPQGQDQQGGGPGLQQLQGGNDSPQGGAQQEIKAVNPACSYRMPGPIVQASTGGTSPRTNQIYPSFKHQPIKGKGGQEQEGEHQEDSKDHKEGAVWVEGSKEDDNRRYRDLMAYMEEKRVEAKELLKRGKRWLGGRRTTGP